jgi:hypothetical protein
MLRMAFPVPRKCPPRIQTTRSSQPFVIGSEGGDKEASAQARSILLRAVPMHDFDAVSGAPQVLADFFGDHD